MRFENGQKVKIIGGANYGKEGIINHFKGVGKWKDCENCPIYHVTLSHNDFGVGGAPTFIDVPVCFLEKI